ncbi:HDOD domain-containing protein [Pseudoalteromonas sp. NBT06-2]|uniref:HDOD domain-containing protein n=1 Tax=Pseudoalteromonas sp. NBT06-2 TaxID=2025950 RepID=UPI001482F8B6|nr:HDOD domain-containing protein [Pseudoalteromonas sp. NBT06-2]
MFKRLIKTLFTSQALNTQKSDLDYFERTRNSPTSFSDLPTVTFPDNISATKLPIKPINKHDGDFHHFLFGKSEKQNEIDAFSIFVSTKIEHLLLSPKSLLDQLPVLPSTVTTLMSEIKKDDFDLNKILKLIEQEPSMAADVIKIANSAFYKRGDKQATDLKIAFMNLGTKGLFESVLVNYTKRLSPISNIYFKQFGEKIWQHSLKTAIYSKKIYTASSNNNEESIAYLVGLIRNLGKMVIFQIMIEAFSHVDPSVAPNSQAFKNLISTFATRLTYTIAKYWQLPDEILNAIAKQTKMKAVTCEIAQAVYEANIISELEFIFEADIIDENEYKLRCRQRLTSPVSFKLAQQTLDNMK